MDSSAVDAIGKLAISAAGLNKLASNTPAIIHEGKVISLEHLNVGRSRFRGSYTSDSLESFAEYVTANADEEAPAAGFVDAKNMSARAFFNLGTTEHPGHADWTATLKLQPTPEYAAMLGINGKRLEQRELVEWIEDWGAHIEPIKSDGTPIPAAQALAAIRKRDGCSARVTRNPKASSPEPSPAPITSPATPALPAKDSA